MIREFREFREVGGGVFSVVLGSLLIPIYNIYVKIKRETSNPMKS